MIKMARYPFVEKLSHLFDKDKTINLAYCTCKTLIFGGCVILAILVVKAKSA